MRSPKGKGKAFWSRVEQAGETMAFGLRFFYGLIFSLLFADVGWWIGSHVWVGIALVIGVVAFPLGFLIGFFWLEVKFMIRLLLGSFGGE